jgi:eukaryotic translation initiation factor 2C
MDAKANRYATSTRFQKPRSEIMIHLSEMVKELLLHFYAENNQIKPQRLLFYRDGISTSQFDRVLQFEVEAIRQACRELEYDYRPAITFTILQKQHHARFFPMVSGESDRSGNTPAGTVIDRVVTHPREFDF